MSKVKYTFKIGLLFVLFCVLVVILYRVSPISQEKSYHQFADARTLFGIPYFANIVSNLLPIALGIWGVFFLSFSELPFFHHPQERGVWIIFFGGAILASLGSMFYHWNPSNFSLAVDRFLLSIVFMTFFSLMIIEHVHFRIGLWLFPWLLLAGVSSVLYWIFTENLSQGDLRPYILIQFFPLLAIPLILLFFSASYSGQQWLWASLATYGVSKIFELTDRETFEFFHGQLSGHTLKHFFVGISLFFIIIYLKTRKIKTK
ncbi:MAG: hypothetical protein K1060chlam3_00661 [Candidatus Anoxychlamydiales bacterium]|nr:hypothetical protein [Candidatus Anoxychlamydiales bacterium]